MMRGSGAVRAGNNDQKKSLGSLEVNGVVVSDTQHYLRRLTGYHAEN